jgi:predicted TIM-barrel fold metal-dependent hydrolase
MRIIDAHHHLWNLDAGRYSWLAPESGPHGLVGDLSAIRRNYGIDEFRADIAEIGAGTAVVKSVHVQAEYDRADPVAETAWLQSIADRPDSGGFPHAIVAFADLAAPDAEAVLEAHCRFANMRGVREILNHHPDRRLTFIDRADLMDDPHWRAGYKLLARFGLSFDLQIYPHQMAQAADLAARFPEVPVVLNHTGMPADQTEDGLLEWRRGMRRLAECPHVSVKISGLGMVDHAWTVDSIRPFVLDTIEIFGPGRCLFASNFPVDSLFGGYAALWQAYDAITAGLPEATRAALFHDNAARVYRI